LLGNLASIALKSVSIFIRELKTFLTQDIKALSIVEENVKGLRKDLEKRYSQIFG